MPRLIRPALITAFLLWLAFVLAAFYVVQKPITADDGAALAEAFAAWSSPISPSALLDAALNVITIALFGFVAMSTGVWLGPKPDTARECTVADRLEYWLLRTGLGFGAIALVVLVLALAGWVQPIILAIIGIVLCAIEGKATLIKLRADIAIIRRVQLPRPLFLLLTVSVVISLLMALTPPTAWDGLVYHLTVPQRVIAESRLLPQGDIIPHEDFPLLMSSLFLAAMDMRGDIAAQGIHWLFGVMCIGLVALTAFRNDGRPSVTYALALVLSVPMLLLLASWAYNDAALAFYIVAAAYAYDRWRSTSKDYFLTMAGCMTGFAMGLKYTSFVLPVGIVALLAWELRRKSLQPIIHFAVVAVMVAAPWYVKNYLFTGNPVYPFILGGVDWDAMRAAWYARPGTGIGFDPVTLLTLPLTITLGTRDASYFDGRTGPLLLVMLPLLVLLERRLHRLLWLAAIFFLFWVSGVIGTSSLWQSRLLLPAILLLIPSLSGGLAALARFDHPLFSLQRMLNGVIAIVLVVTLVVQIVGMLEMNPAAYVAGAESRAQFLVRALGTHAEAMNAVATLPPSARVQFMWEPRSYLAGRIVRADPMLDALPHLIATQGSLAAAERSLKGEGFTHFLVYEAGVAKSIKLVPDLYSPRDAELLAQFERDYGHIIFDNKDYRLLELR